MNLDRDLNRRRNKVLNSIEVYLKDQKNSQNTLARAIGISASVVSPYRGGTYGGNIENVTKKFEDFFALAEKRLDLIIEPAFVKTSQSQRIWNAISEAHVLQSICVIVSSSGVGKTKTFIEYQRQRSGVYYIECDPYMKSLANFTQALCDALSIPGGKGTRAHFLRARTLLAQQGALVILDEAQRIMGVTRSGFNVTQVIQSIKDQGVGFIVGGNNRIRERVTTANNEDFYQQFASRTEIQIIPDTFTEADLHKIIEAVVAQKVSIEVFNYLYRVANDYIGSLRVVVRALNKAVLIANSLGETLSVPFIEEALKKILSQVKYKPRKEKTVGLTKNKTGGSGKPIVGKEEPLSATA